MRIQSAHRDSDLLSPRALLSDQLDDMWGHLMSLQMLSAGTGLLAGLVLHSWLHPSKGLDEILGVFHALGWGALIFMALYAAGSALVPRRLSGPGLSAGFALAAGAPALVWAVAPAIAVLVRDEMAALALAATFGAVASVMVPVLQREAVRALLR